MGQRLIQTSDLPPIGTELALFSCVVLCHCYRFGRVEGFWSEQIWFDSSSRMSPYNILQLCFPVMCLLIFKLGLPMWLSGKESACPCRRCKRCWFHPWVGKNPWSRKWQPSPVFLPGKFHRQRSLVGYSPWGSKELDTLEKLSTKALRDKQDPALFAEDVYLVGERAILHVSSIMLKSVQISLRVQKKGSVQCSRSRKPSARRSHLAPCQEEKAVGRTWGQEAEKAQSRPRQDAESLAAEPGAIWVQVTELGCRACWAELFAEGLV